MTATVADAVGILAARTDHGAGFRTEDIALGHRLAATVKATGGLSPAQTITAHGLLARYVDRLAAARIDYAALPVPPQPVPASRQDPTPTAGKPESRVGLRPNGRIFTFTPWRYADAMKSIAGGRWHKAAKCPQCKVGRCPYVRGVDGWSFPGLPRVALALDEILAPAGYIDEPGFRDLLGQAQVSESAKRLRGLDDLPPIPGLLTSAWAHQRQGYWFGVEQRGVLLDMEMGTGKSLLATGLLVAKAPQRALILCPDRVIGVWPKQIGTHAGSDAFHVLDGRRRNRNGKYKLMKIADRVAQFDEAIHGCNCERPHVCITNYAATVHSPFKEWGLKQSWDAVVFDEIHKIKSPTGKWSRWCRDVGRRADFRVGLTGTLMPNSPMDVFGQVSALDEGVFGKTWTGFKNRYAKMGGYEGKEITGVRPDREDELAQRVSDVTYRVGAEVLDLPDEIPDVRLLCTIGPKAQRVYDLVEAQIVADIINEDGTPVAEVTVDNVLTKLLRLAQITGGAIKGDDGETYEIDTAKADLLADVLSDIDDSKPVVVFCQFHHDLEVIARVAKDLGRSYGELSGRKKHDHDDALAFDGTLAPGIQVAGVQIQAGGTGVDFTRSHYAIYYSTGVALGEYLQSRKRLLRPGQTESVRFIHLTAEGTRDEDIADALAAKQDVAEYIGGLVRAEQEGRPRRLVDPETVARLIAEMKET